MLALARGAAMTAVDYTERWLEADMGEARLVLRWRHAVAAACQRHPVRRPGRTCLGSIAAVADALTVRVLNEPDCLVLTELYCGVRELASAVRRHKDTVNGVLHRLVRWGYLRRVWQPGSLPAALFLTFPSVHGGTWAIDQAIARVEEVERG